MLFNTFQYGAFFVVVFALHWMMPQSWRRPFLLLASLYFYASAIPQYLILIVALTIFNYALGLWMSATQGRLRKTLLWVAIAGDLGSLAYFKYTELFLSTLQPVLAHLPLLHRLTSDPLLVNILLPLGISFFTFEFIHYIVEVYRGLTPMRNPLDFALFAAFFPTQIAGPIKRFPDFRKQLDHPISLNKVDLDGGIGLILRGLLKKMLVADILAPVVGEMFAKPGALGPAAAWFAVLAFAAQIYCDFSGYTDIGRGSAMLLGYAVPENFQSPYQSANPAEFWHRWHMSLSTWLRDYLYIPLGGSRVSKPRIYLNLMITMALGGLWHGAQWHFMVWGIYQGVLLCAHRLWSRTVGKMPSYQRLMRFPLFNFLARPITLVLVCLGWVFFRANSLGGAFDMIKSMFALQRPLLAGWTLAPTSEPVLLLAGAAVIVLGGWLIAVAKGPLVRLAGSVRERVDSAWWWAISSLIARPALYATAICLLTLWPPHAAQRFIYFQF